VTPADENSPVRPVLATPGGEDRPDAWVRWVVGWHVAFWLLIALAAIWTLTAGHLHGTGQVRALALIAALSAAYAATVQRPGIVQGWRGRIYLLIAIPLTGLACALDPSLSLLLFMVYPQTWMFAESTKEGAFFTGLLTAAAMLGFLTDTDWSLEAMSDLLPQALASLLFSVLLGFWISRIIDQSGERADLIAQLEATRSELAEAEHARGVMAERERLAREIHDTWRRGSRASSCSRRPPTLPWSVTLAGWLRTWPRSRRWPVRTSLRPAPWSPPSPLWAWRTRRCRTPSSGWPSGSSARAAWRSTSRRCSRTGAG
jgi:hypothetical protein